MIKHAIIVVKPRTMPPQFTAANNKFNSQEEYDAFLKDMPFFEGQVITLSPTEVFYLGACAIVVSIERDYSRLSYTPYGNHRAKVMHIMQLPSDVAMANRNSPWSRWDSLDGYRLLSQEEHKRLVEPNRDLIQDYCAAQLGSASPLIAREACDAGGC